MIWLRETFVNQTENCLFGESEPYETMYETSELGKLFRALQREYGRCTSHVYLDTKTEEIPVGWVFEKRMEYEDARPDWPKAQRFYVREVWCHLYVSEPLRKVSYDAQPLRLDKREAI